MIYYRWKALESILPKKIFAIHNYFWGGFAMKLGPFMAKAFLLCNRHWSLTSKIGKQSKRKSCRIESRWSLHLWNNCLLRQLPAESSPKWVIVPLSGTCIFSRQQKAKSFGASISWTSREASITKSVILGPMKSISMAKLVNAQYKTRNYWDHINYTNFVFVFDSSKLSYERLLHSHTTSPPHP